VTRSLGAVRRHSAPVRSVGESTFQLVSELQKVLESLPIGASLPAEAALAEQFGVSRLTVREALKVLAGRGLAEIRQGRKAVVTEPSSEVISSIFVSYVRRDPSALLELVEVRRALEVQSVGLAARKVTRAGLTAMEACLRAMKESADILIDATSSDEQKAIARAEFQRADVSFHEAIALSSGNRMLAHVLEALEDSLLRAFDASFEGNASRGGSALDPYRAHLKIFQFIEARDARKAMNVMREHLQQSEKDLKTYLAQGTTAMANTARDESPQLTPALKGQQ
jgi:GntR family transcriptional regulator, transcriptional repressor for pyruvate dehydrogenase complex